jgi:hypothetical protein
MTLVVKIAAIAAFFVCLLVITKLIKTIIKQNNDFAKLQESHNRTLAELNVHEAKAVARMEYEYEC